MQLQMHSETHSFTDLVVAMAICIYLSIQRFGKLKYSVLKIGSFHNFSREQSQKILNVINHFILVDISLKYI